MIIADESLAIIIAIIIAGLFGPSFAIVFFSKFIADESVPPFAIIIAKIVEDE